MSWKLGALWMALFGMFAFGLAACGQNAPRHDASPQTPAAAAAPAKDSSNPAGREAQAGPSSAISEADRKLIEKQKVCPVSGEPLGTMGAPVKVVVKGRTVFLCCDGCKEKLLADPDTYLKKLDQKK
jgi:YHS domain-containing protein